MIRAVKVRILLFSLLNCPGNKFTIKGGGWVYIVREATKIFVKTIEKEPKDSNFIYLFINTKYGKLSSLSQ